MFAIYLCWRGSEGELRHCWNTNQYDHICGFPKLCSNLNQFTNQRLHSLTPGEREGADRGLKRCRGTSGKLKQKYKTKWEVCLKWGQQVGWRQDDLWSRIIFQSLKQRLAECKKQFKLIIQVLKLRFHRISLSCFIRYNFQ